MPSKAEGGPPSTLVLLCRDLESRVTSLDPAMLARELTASAQGLRVLVRDGLCHNPAAIGTALRGGVQRLVLGLCSGDYPELEIQALGRKAGLDPLGIQAVDLGRSCSAAAPMAAARLLLKAAVAHATAFPGSRPDNLKSVFLPGQQKVSRRALFTLPPVSYVPVPTINRALCTAEAGCQQCVAACPHAALTRGSSAVLVDRDRCQSCGACMAVCPERAVEFPGWSAAELEAEATALLDGGQQATPPDLGFVCKNAVAPMAGGWLPLRVPCLAMIPTGAILQVLAQGAASVALVRCEGGCASGASDAAQGRVDYCRRLLGLLGDEPQRVQFASSPGKLSEPPVTPACSTWRKGVEAVPLRLFGRAATAEAISALAARGAGVPQVALEHPQSPLGCVRLDLEACTACGACASGCPTGALTSRHEAETLLIAFDHARCIACGQCVSLCPERAAGAIELSLITDLQLLPRGQQVLLRDQEALCQRCGAPVASRRALKRIAELLGPAYNERLGTLCTDCRGLSL